jgi:hypothetical protein
MAYVIKWLKPDGELGQSEPHASPSEALRFSRTLAALRPERIWAEDDLGHQFRITVDATAPDG